MSATVTHVGVAGTITALTPLHTGGDEKTGSTPVLRSIGMWDPIAGEEYRIPFVSGNSIRGVLRRLIMHDMLSLLGYELPSPKAHHILFTGGVLESTLDNTGKVDLAFRNHVRRTVPPLEVLGTSVSNQMLAGCCVVEMALPICDELAWQWPDLEHPFKTVSVREFVDETFSTRRDDLRADRSEDEQAMQMMVGFEVFKPGTVFVHGFELAYASPLAVSCLGRMIDLWREWPFAGAKSGTGHGRLLLRYDGVPDAGPYVAYMYDNRDAVAAVLDELCAKVQPAKGAAKGDPVGDDAAVTDGGEDPEDGGEGE